MKTYAHDAHCNSPHEAGPEPCPPPTDFIWTKVREELTRVTVNLTPQAVKAMNAISARAGLGKTDCINRALRVCNLVEELANAARDDGALVIVNDLGEQQRIYIL